MSCRDADAEDRAPQWGSSVAGGEEGGGGGGAVGLGVRVCSLLSPGERRRQALAQSEEWEMSGANW